MGKEGYLIIAIIVIVALVAIFVISFVIFKKTPAPKGCENLKISEENCKGCTNESCSHHIDADPKEEEKE